MADEKKRGYSAVVGKTMNWGMVGKTFNIRPYRLTSGSIDIMNVNVREKIDIHGVGMDVVQMSGFFTVRTENPVALTKEKDIGWDNFVVNTQFKALELVGFSELFGNVRVRLHETDKLRNLGTVESSAEFSGAGKCKAELNVTIELPDLDMELQTEKPVTMASKVIQIPPVGDVARSEQGSGLIDLKTNKITGEIVSSDIEVGQVMHSQPLEVGFK